MIFNAEDECTSFALPTIHVFNKNESSLPTAFSDQILARPNIILLGDSLGDLRMGDGIAHDVKLTVGFLNHDEEVLMQGYLDAYDVVLVGDGGFELLLSILQSL
jgi:cytosolic 5'-nucleotidase 3